MSRFSRATCALALVSSLVVSLPAAAQQPNILLIVADDYGTNKLCGYRAGCVEGSEPPAYHRLRS